MHNNYLHMFFAEFIKLPAKKCNRIFIGFLTLNLSLNSLYYRLVLLKFKVHYKEKKS